MEKLGHLKILSERMVKMVELDVDMDEKTIDRLAHAGFNLIKYERNDLASYAIKKAFEAMAKGGKKCTQRIKRSNRKSLQR